MKIWCAILEEVCSAYASNSINKDAKPYTMTNKGLVPISNGGKTFRAAAHGLKFHKASKNHNVI